MTFQASSREEVLLTEFNRAFEKPIVELRNPRSRTGMGTQSNRSNESSM